MQKIVGTPEALSEAHLSRNTRSSTGYNVPQIALPQNLEGMVSNLRDKKFEFLTRMPGVRQNVDTDFTIQQVMNLTPLVKKSTTQHTDPVAFFQQMGCERPPSSCTSEHLKGFYSLTDGCLLSNWMSIRGFLDFDVYSSLKKIHENSFSDDLKGHMKELMTEWCRIRTKATNEIVSSDEFLPYFKDVSLFQRKLHAILTIKKKTDPENLSEKNIGTAVRYHFPKILNRLERNYQFLMQFIGKEYSPLLVNISLSQLSGTHNMVPKKFTRSAEVMKNLYDFAELMIESSIAGKTSKVSYTHPALLQDILSQIRALVDVKNRDLLVVGCKNFMRECEKNALALTGQVFSILGYRNRSYQDGIGCVSGDFLARQIALLCDKTKTMQTIGLSETVDLLYDLSFFVEDSILSVADLEYVNSEGYQNRIYMVLASLYNELCNFGETGKELEEMPCEDQSAFVCSERGQFLEKSRIHFFDQLKNSIFFKRTSDYLDSMTSTSQHMLVHFCYKNLHDILKPLTEEAVLSLKTECSQYSPGDYRSISLFDETKWLAKALLLVHDMGCFLQDPAFTQDIEFHPDYLDLIHQYDPSIGLQGGAQASEEQGVGTIPEMRMHVLFDEEDKTETKREGMFASLPAAFSLPSSSPRSLPSRATAAAQINRPAVAKMAPTLGRNELKDAIRRTQGDLRQMSRVLRSMLGGDWSITQSGQRHPTIFDGRGRPVAPIPHTGHAGIGTVLNIANTVCDVAQAQGLITLPREYKS